jgi:hypothetical protein
LAVGAVVDAGFVSDLAVPEPLEGLLEVLPLLLSDSFLAADL